ncbi:zinc fingers and homeoboxes protein 2 [Antennarius striatus]|uniref:zinc fingers and homeoboxes protein 2 n=1 Tax=Antennarius striatus TaxID=241820 RepID=UPI0035B3A82B
MSSRRKSSVPCMVRVFHKVPEEQDDPEEVMDKEILAENDVTENYKSESSTEKSRDPRQDNPENPHQQEFPKPVEKQSPEDEFGDNQQPPVIEDVEAGAKDIPTSQKKQTRGYDCKYCPFSTQNLNDFKEHVDSSHPNVILNPLYLCAVCNFNTKKFDSLTEHNERKHPGETNFKFKRIQVNSQTVLEQTIEGRDHSVDCERTEKPGEGDSGPKMPPSTPVKPLESTPSFLQGGKTKSQLNGLHQKDQITALNINGTVIIPEAAILQGLNHVTPMLQRPPNFTSAPKVAVPLNTSKYNPSLDHNLTLITSFNKFPYPTHAELSWLTAASKHPEEQIKVWFTTQRLKQGITWSPEEVEEARKKMFNGSIPAAHHTFPAVTTSPSSQSVKFSQQPLVHTVVRHPSHVRTTVSNGLGVVTAANPSFGFSSGLAHKRTHLTTVFGPDCKRPIMAVAPHSGGRKDGVLMAPPPPPPPQKDRLPMAAPPTPTEVKRPAPVPLVITEIKRPSATVPLMPPPPSSSSSSSSPSSLSKGKAVSNIGNPKTKPVVSLPSIVFPESLTRPMIAPPPIFAPPFQNLLVSLTSAIPSKEKHPSSHVTPAADLKLASSPPLLSPQVRRPTIIQSIHAPAKTPTQIPRFPFDKKLTEQQRLELKVSYPRGDKGLPPGAEADGISCMDGNWPHDQTALPYNSGVVPLDGGDQPPLSKVDVEQKTSVLTQFPLLERMKGKTAEQLNILEENFLSNSFPTRSDVDGLAVSTRLSQQEIDSWFVERRALRDNMEQALLNSMGTKRGSSGGVTDTSQKGLYPQPAVQLNGTHKTNASMGHLQSPAPPSQASTTRSTAHANPSSMAPDRQSGAVLSEDLAQTRWPPPEDSGLEGLAQPDFACWFNGNQPHSVEVTERYHGNGGAGGQGPSVGSPGNTPPTSVQDGVVTGNQVLEVELGWLVEQGGTRLSRQPPHLLQDHLSARARQQNSLDLKTRRHNGGVREVFGSWLQDGHSRRGPELLLDRDRKTAEDPTGRLTG